MSEANESKRGEGENAPPLAQITLIQLRLASKLARLRILLPSREKVCSDRAPLPLCLRREKVCVVHTLAPLPLRERGAQAWQLAA
ncbi:MAG: hypothetical protein Q27BB25_18670 [Blastomonas sp. CACIA14H2]|nr:MAG: hypothetical protein Q27BB25_18670 [Blastomonas sp. CACIA14H2]